MRPKPILVYMQKQMQGRLCAEMAHLVPWPLLTLSLSLSFSIRGGGNTDDDDDDHATIRGVTGTGKGKTGVGRRERKIGRQNSRSPTTICRRRKAR